MFCTLAGSCAGHLLREWEVKKFMRVHVAKDAETANLKETGKLARRWKEAWLDSVKQIDSEC